MKSQLRGDQTAKKVDIQRRPLGLDRISCRWITLVLERLLCLCNTGVDNDHVHASVLFFRSLKRFSCESQEDTSVVMKSSRLASRESSAGGGRRSAITTIAPLDARRRADACPIPDEPPNARASHASSVSRAENEIWIEESVDN
jgi:hypothetical protein